jgi:hypothetical protein
MTDPEHFLSRWSRKKRDAVDQSTPVPLSTDENDLKPVKSVDGKAVEPPAVPTATEPAFDPASLPSIDSIGAQTDVRAFLQAGVPPDLTRAALRRAWTADPAILNFKGLQENDWDFNDPNSMFGFGELDPDFDVKRMLASVFGETPKEETVENVTPEPSPPLDETTANGDDQVPDRVGVPAVTDEIGVGLENAGTKSNDPASDGRDIVQRTSNNIASQRNESNAAAATHRHVRLHGGALPQ